MAENLRVHVLRNFTSPDIMHQYAAGQIIEIDQARLDYLLSVAPKGTFAVEGAKAEKAKEEVDPVAKAFSGPPVDKQVKAPAKKK
jgi:hypothetical protein